MSHFFSDVVCGLALLSRSHSFNEFSPVWRLKLPVTPNPPIAVSQSQQLFIYIKTNCQKAYWLCSPFSNSQWSVIFVHSYFRTKMKFYQNHQSKSIHLLTTWSRVQEENISALSHLICDIGNKCKCFNIPYQIISYHHIIISNHTPLSLTDHEGTNRAYLQITQKNAHIHFVPFWQSHPSSFFFTNHSKETTASTRLPDRPLSQS